MMRIRRDFAKDDERHAKRRMRRIETIRMELTRLLIEWKLL